MGKMMNFRTFVVVCVVQALLVGCGGGGSDSSTNFLKQSAFSTVNFDEDDFNVTGVASAGGAPLVGVTVSATNRKGEVIQSTTTDTNGRYKMQIPGGNAYVLSVPFNDIDGSPAVLTSVYAFNGNFSGNFIQVNLNPLTSLITSRVLGFIPTTTPTGEQIKNAIVNPSTVATATQEIASLFEPIYNDNALKIPADWMKNPIGNADYQANRADPLENLFLLARFKVRSGEVSIGTGADRFVMTVPASGALTQNIPASAVNSLVALNNSATTTPIKHVIVVIGENRSFDAVFATYQAPAGQTVKNLLSQGIINADGSAGPHFALARQNKAVAQTTYTLNPQRTVAFEFLPQPTLMGVVIPPSLVPHGGEPDWRFPTDLASGPFQQTKYIPYIAPNNPIGATSGDPPHRFFQMWQQTAGTNEKLDLYTWVAVTAGQGGDTLDVFPHNPGQGGELMAFLNMHTGDVPYWKSLAQEYSISDNYHQSIMGGTGANFFAIATGDVPYFNVNGAIAAPFANQIENPNPMQAIDNPNFYIKDGYRGGSYVNCSDAGQPGVAPILAALATKQITSKCEAGKYYLVNNYGLGYDKDGNVQPIGPNNFNLPPQTIPTIAEALAKKGITWKWYTGGREMAEVIPIANAFGVPPLLAQGLLYNAIGDPLVGSENIMGSSALKANLVGSTTFDNDLKNNTLPAVSFVVPTNLDNGHPGHSVQAKYEQFTKNLITKVKAKPELWANTAILLITDEGGGYFDTGPIQMQDFFGDGPRIPLLVISPYARKNYIDHTYNNHASLLKFIERNWRLEPLSTRSRDNHPVPVTTSADLYRPINKTPTMGDLMTMFEF
jgi:acid phosphatase